MLDSIRRLNIWNVQQWLGRIVTQECEQMNDLGAMFGRSKFIPGVAFTLPMWRLVQT